MLHESGGLALMSCPVEDVLVRDRRTCYGWFMRWVLIYELVDDYVERRAALRGQHLDLARAAHERGELLLAGALADPYDRALLVFAGDSSEMAEEFARNDPYVLKGLVTAWEVRQWNEVLASP
jgi:uncharacterized protein